MKQRASSFHQFCFFNIIVWHKIQILLMISEWIEAHPLSVDTWNSILQSFMNQPDSVTQIMKKSWNTTNGIHADLQNIHLFLDSQHDFKMENYTNCFNFFDYFFQHYFHSQPNLKIDNLCLWTWILININNVICDYFTNSQNVFLSFINVFIIALM